MACKQAAPQLYKPRKGKINGNKEKYGKKQLEKIMAASEEIIKKFGYDKYFKEDVSEVIKVDWIKEHNEEVLMQSIYNQTEATDVIALMMNTPS